ncbi:MAG: glycosyltransferase family 2 protein [Chloroflexi bacterium]|nr:glycosyltransferase family 2 protein [Chloroflexota bacterium]MCI0579824.1 glycosyltransferase family 2 protein [Chloroflexota bacterium]MCI0646750.1 glycosyltransferase family 2 protein [Chloroflexota bacterium]MCI0728914.1 glycosyltransferase family 2 protein [Chloroflexota bacterium]
MLSVQRLLILIPAYNEQRAVGQVVHNVRRVVPGADVLVVDDGSQDQTAWEAEAAGALVVRHPFNLGIGATVQTGLKFARQQGYDMVIRLDGDGQHNPADIPTLVAALQARQADVVIGSRFLSQTANMAVPLSRRLGILTFAFLVSLITGRRATDTTSGFAGLNRRAIHSLAGLMPQDYPEVESRVILHKSGLTTLEVPTRMQARRSGVSSINHWRALYYAFKVSVAALIATLKDVPRAPKEL